MASERQALVNDAVNGGGTAMDEENPSRDSVSTSKTSIEADITTHTDTRVTSTNGADRRKKDAAVTKSMMLSIQMNSYHLSVICAILFALSICMTILATRMNDPRRTGHFVAVKKQADGIDGQQRSAAEDQVYYFDTLRSVAIESRIVEVSDPDAIHDLSTPQGKAFRWIIDQDEMELNPEATNVVQRYILAVLYFSTKGEKWEYGHAKWLRNVNECQWFEKIPSGPVSPFGTSSVRSHKAGVLRCDGHGNIQQIDLSRNHISGVLPPELGYLPKLEMLQLGENSIGGEIPSTLGNLTALKQLGLESNKLEGTVPFELGQLANLEELYLDYNNGLTGGIPFSICFSKTQNDNKLEIRADCAKKTGTMQCSCCDMCCNGKNLCIEKGDMFFL